MRPTSLDKATEHIPYDEYKKTLPIAREIWYTLNGQPTSTQMVARSYNEVGMINRVIIKNRIKNKNL